MRMQLVTTLQTLFWARDDSPDMTFETSTEKHEILCTCPDDSKIAGTRFHSNLKPYQLALIASHPDLDNIMGRVCLSMENHQCVS